MNCVAIPPPEEKPLQILHNELTLPLMDTGNNGVDGDTGGGGIGKTQSLQRTTHLYCRSLEKERVDRRTSSRGLTSCLRGERDEFLDYRELRPQMQLEYAVTASGAISAGETSGTEASGRKFFSLMVCAFFEVKSSPQFGVKVNAKGTERKQ